MRRRSTTERWTSLIPALALLQSCGAGVVAVVASTDESGGGTTPALTAFAVPDPKVSPARIVMEASTGLEVEMEFSVPGRSDAMTLVPGPGITGNRAQLAAGANELAWDFKTDLGTSALTPDVTLRAKHGGAPVEGGVLALFGMGNDPPEVLLVDPLTPSGEALGIVEVVLKVSDSSADVVSLLVEWRRASDAPDDWKLATVGGVPAGVETSASGVSFSFFWKTESDALGSADDDFVLRVTADDGTVDREERVGIGRLESRSFRVDNNAAPVMQLDSGPILANPDERRGIPVPFKVFDEEGDLVEVVLQWRRPDEDFPDLPSGQAALDAILADPVQRAAHHVCTPYPRFARGRALPVDATTIRLQELALGESWVLHAGLERRTLELLRPSAIPAPITPSWIQNPLVEPIAALPVGDGLTAVVLERQGTSAWRLSEVELATGRLVHAVAASGGGTPSTMAFERGEKAVLVASDFGGLWRIERVELASGAVTELVVSDGTVECPVRGLASLGTNALLFTAGSALHFADTRDPPGARVSAIVSDLAEPWGVVVDPLSPHRVYLAERAADRVLALELDSHGLMPVAARSRDLAPAELPRPSALALEQRGSRLLAVTEPTPGSLQFVGLGLGDGRNVVHLIGSVLPGTSASLASGEEELRLLVVPVSAELLAGGGVEQQREIAVEPDYDPSTQRLGVVAPFDPPPRPGQPWRIGAPPLLPASSEGFAATFVWDTSADLPSGGSAFLRALARDAEAGVAVEGAAVKPLSAALEVEPLALDPTPAFDMPRSVAAADFDGDGDLELAAANSGSDRVTVFFQDAPGSFAAPALALDPTPDIDDPLSVAAADLDGDGDQDLVSANEGDSSTGSSLTVFFQDSPGSFAAPALALDSTPAWDRPASVAAADLDGDGDLELLAANFQSDRVTVFFQGSPGSFATPALALDPTPDPGDGPVSVAAADLDGDGDLELLAANQSSDCVTVFFQDSPGSFGAPALALDPTPAFEVPVSVAAADLDGDGDLDLLAANAGSDSVTVFFQDSPGSFAAPALALATPADDSPVSVVAADLDGNGDLELLAANRDSVMVFFQDSPGSFAAPTMALDPTPAPDDPRSIAAADLDGDGDLELVAANEDSDSVTVFFQDSPGSFDAPALALDPTPAPFDRPRSVAAADLDGDGNLDLLAANSGSGAEGSVMVFFQGSPGTFAAPALSLDPTPDFDSPLSVAAADLDGDGDLELVAGGGDRVTVFFQDSPGSFASPALALDPTPTPFDRPRSVAAADLDGDGDHELVAANESDRVTVFFQDSPGSFAGPALALDPTPASDRPSSVAAADLDGDGDLDLVAANFLSDRVTVFFQDSPGSFAAPALALDPTPAGDGPLSVAAADLDGDGDQDLVSANGGNFQTGEGGILTVFLQDSPGSFAAPALALDPTPAYDQPVSVAAADLDGDGDLDLLAANERSGRVTVFWGGR